MVKSMEKEFILGKMGINMKERMKMINIMEKEHIFIQMGINMKECLQMVINTVKEHTPMPTETLNILSIKMACLLTEATQC